MSLNDEKPLPDETRPIIAALVQKVEESKQQIAALTAERDALQERVHQMGYRPRPKNGARGRTVSVDVGCGPLYITLNEDEQGRPFEVFFKLGKSGSCQGSYLDALGVAMSIGLRHGADIGKFVEKFQGMRCPNPLSKMMNAGRDPVWSCADGISQGLGKALEIAVRLPGLDVEGDAPSGKHDASIADVAEPSFMLAPVQDDVVDIVGQPVPARNGSLNGHGAVAMAEAPKKMSMNGAGLCPKCQSNNLIPQGGCLTCQGQCGYEKCG